MAARVSWLSRQVVVTQSTAVACTTGMLVTRVTTATTIAAAGAGGQRTCELGALGGTRTPNLLMRRSGQALQDRPSRSVRWADIPELSTCVGRRPAAWQQC
jgi:hypothetical protein